MRKSAKITGIAILFLAIVSFLVWSAALQDDHRGQLRVSFLAVGQGDAIFIESPSGIQALVDGGPDASVLRALSAKMSWWDHSLDLVVSTSPAKSASTGLVDVLSRFSVASILRSGVESTDAFSRALSDAIKAAEDRGTKVTVARRGQVVNLGDGAYLEVLSPDRSIPRASAAEGCTVARLVYGATSFLLPCDAPQSLENYLAYLDGKSLHSDVLKLGHQGAKISSSPTFVGYVSPTHAVYSRSCDEPHAKETEATLSRFGVEAHDTCEEGTVTFISDGKTVRKD